jgi:uncharacterized LabA/DUF88 family protein
MAARLHELATKTARALRAAIRKPAPARPEPPPRPDAGPGGGPAAGGGDPAPPRAKAKPLPRPPAFLPRPLPAARIRPAAPPSSFMNHTTNTDATMAVFLDLENIARGAQDARYPRFDIQMVLERLLLKGHIVVKKAYCDFDRFKEFKRDLHEAAFELIEIPHVRQSGKNSADIRMVVDALDLCYTKGHVDTFVIISGDSDFSPLVSKLRENAKTVIGAGVKNSTSDLFINNCDEFLYYDDLVRKVPAKAKRRSAAKPAAPEAEASPAKAADDPAIVVEPKAPPVNDAFELLVATLEALSEERAEDERIWGSMIKQTIRRRNPGFNERAYGFRSFNELLVEAEKRGLIALQADEKSGGYMVGPVG